MTEESGMTLSEAIKALANSEQSKQIRKSKQLSEYRRYQMTPEYGKLISEINIAIKSRTMIITFPDKHEEVSLGLRPFCRLYDLDRSALIRVAQGKQENHKGFKARYADVIKD